MGFIFGGFPMEMFCSEDTKELAGAMLKVQADISPATKDSANPFAKSRYASLNSVVTASREALLRHGIWVVQYPVPVESGHLGLVTRMTHASSGQWQSGFMILPLSKLDPQGYGSAMTYARRYSMASLIGIIVDDDDAESACVRPKNGNGNGSNVSSTEDKAPTDSSTPNTVSGNSKLHNLPSLQGVNYQTVHGEDGR
jgi:hypothetical protein